MDSFTYVISDPSGASDSATVNVTVNSVNDAPSFTQGENQFVEEDAGDVIVTDWATDISPGPEDEADQQVTFRTTLNTNPDLFANGPVLTSGGTLKFKPADNAFGNATVAFQIFDGPDGNNPGSTGFLTVYVSPVNDAPVATPDEYFTLEDTEVSFVTNLLVNDFDVDGDKLSVLRLNDVSNGTLTRGFGSHFRYISTASMDFSTGSATAGRSATR